MYRKRWQVETLLCQGPLAYAESVLHHHDCVRVVLPCWKFYSRKHQTDKGSEAWAKGCELVQIWTGLHLTMPYEPYRPISNQCFQILVICLEFIYFLSCTTITSISIMVCRNTILYIRSFPGTSTKSLQCGGNTDSNRYLSRYSLVFSEDCTKHQTLGQSIWKFHSSFKEIISHLLSPFASGKTDSHSLIYLIKPLTY